MVVLVLCPVCRAGSALFACVAVERCEDVPEYELFAAWCPVSKPVSNRAASVL